MDMTNQKDFTNFRLTTLWALSEIGGSLLAVLKVPISGLFISACTVLILALFYENNRENDKPVAIAFLVVVVIKFVFNIIGSPLAFLALFFQVGFCMVCFRYIKPYPKACIIAGVGCLLHSCLQQLYLRHGDPDFWALKTAFLPMAMLDRVILDIVRSNPVFMLMYILLFVVTGWLTGVLAPNLSQFIRNEVAYLSTLSVLPEPQLTPKQIAKQEKQRLKAEKRKAKNKSPYGFPKFLVVAGGILMLLGRFGSGFQLWQISILWLATFTDFFQKYIIPPIQRYFTHMFYPQYLDQPESSGNFGDLRRIVVTAWLIAKPEKKLIRRITRFTALIFALALEGSTLKFESPDQ